MYFSRIAGVAFLPVSILVFSNYFGITALASIVGINLMLLTALGIIIVEISDIVDSHLKSEYVLLSWIVCPLLCLPAIVFFASMFMAIPEQAANSLPLIMASFLFVEGLSSFYIST